MKNNKKYTFIIIAAVIAITFFVLRHSADAPTDTPSIDDTINISESTGYIGLSSDDAIKLAQSNWEAFRIVNINGEPQIVTMDYRPGRINANVVDGIITEFSIEG